MHLGVWGGGGASGGGCEVGGGDAWGSPIICQHQIIQTSMPQVVKSSFCSQASQLRIVIARAPAPVHGTVVGDDGPGVTAVAETAEG